MTRILISAGEASGDMHGGAVTRAIKELDPQAEVYGMGGEAMRRAGAELVFDIKEHSVMGFVEVVKKLPDILRLRNDFRRLLKERRPDCLIVIDYPDFNMRIAKIAHEMGIPVISFISPSAWVWRKGRAKSVAKIVDRVASIFPFEYKVYKEAGANVEFVGHPLADLVHPSLEHAEACAIAGKREGHPLVLLLPGSRLQELKGMLPMMLEAARKIKDQKPGVDFVMPQASTIPIEILQRYMLQAGVEVKVVKGNIYDIMSVADVALATSGTVTLEAALCNLPVIICYKTAWLVGKLVKHLLHVPFIGLPNIVAGHSVVPELLQEEMTSDNMCSWVLRYLEPDENQRIRKYMLEVKQKLGEPGAVKRVAAMALELANGKQS